jgi:hypothetical protein
VRALDRNFTFTQLCLVGVMVIYGLLGQASGDQARDAKIAIGSVNSIEEANRAVPHQMRRSKTPSRREPPFGSVKTFVHDRLFPADGERIDMKDLTAEVTQGWYCH